jgi:hypothetical protein
MALPGNRLGTTDCTTRSGVPQLEQNALPSGLAPLQREQMMSIDEGDSLIQMAGDRRQRGPRRHCECTIGRTPPMA